MVTLPRLAPEGENLLTTAADPVWLIGKPFRCQCRRNLSAVGWIDGIRNANNNNAPARVYIRAGQQEFFLSSELAHEQHFSSRDIASSV